MNNQYYPGGNYYLPQQPIFPQPQGNVYMISNSLEVANIPAGAGITVALCPNENLLYMKTLQNGLPTFSAYKMSPYTDIPKSNGGKITADERIAALEKQVAALVGGSKDESTSANAAKTTAKPAEWEP